VIIVEKRKPVMVLVLFSLLLLVSMVSVVFAQEYNWVEVADFSQNRAFFGNTNSFKIEHSEWRIKWEYEKTLGDLTAFMLEVRITETNQLIANWNNSGKIDITQGVLNITGYGGDFYLWIGTNGNHIVIVEQNTESAPTLDSNWVEVARFNGTTWAENTEHFTIDYFDWRIKWSYTPRLSDTINPYIFRLDVKNASGYIVELLFASNQISGTLNMNQTGEYYLYIDPMHAETYSITIEQKIESIPEFSSWILPSLFITSILVIIAVRNQIRKKG